MARGLGEGGKQEGCADGEADVAAAIVFEATSKLLACGPAASGRVHPTASAVEKRAGGAQKTCELWPCCRAAGSRRDHQAMGKAAPRKDNEKAHARRLNSDVITRRSARGARENRQLGGVRRAHMEEFGRKTSVDGRDELRSVARSRKGTRGVEERWWATGACAGGEGSGFFRPSHPELYITMRADDPAPLSSSHPVHPPSTGSAATTASEHRTRLTPA